MKVGKYLSYDIGQLIYIAKPVQKAGISIGIIVLIVILVLLIIAIIALFVVMKQRRIGPFKDKTELNYMYRNGQNVVYDPEGQRLLDQNRANGEYETKEQAFRLECVLEKYFLYFSCKTYVVGTQKNRFNETVLLSTQNTCLNY